MSTKQILGYVTTYQIRKELEDLVINDLLGPAAGPGEEVDERSVRDRYLVGMLAPQKVSEEMVTPAGEGEEEFPPTGYDDSTEGGTGNTEDGTHEADAPKGMNLFPSSFGMTFSVDKSAKEIQITARWGHYRKEPSESIKRVDTGDPKRVWKRTQIEATSEPVPLKKGTLEKWIPSSEFPDVWVQGLVRQSGETWIVTLFLVNGQKALKKEQDRNWLFQPELLAESPGGSSIFCRRMPFHDSSNLDLGHEERRNEMLYRRHVEFAVGHGVSVHWEQKEGETDRAFRVMTRVIPAYEVPLTDQPTLDDIPDLSRLELDMKNLSQLAEDEFEKRLGPIVSIYSDWIEGEKAKIGDSAEGLGEFQDAAGMVIGDCEKTRDRIQAGIRLLSNPKNDRARRAFRFMNEAMWKQRIHTLHSERVRRGLPSTLEEVDEPKNRSWRPFQLAFILINLPSLSDASYWMRSVRAPAWIRE